MKKGILIYLSLALSAQTVQSQTNVQPNLTEITVFHMGAELTHELDVNLKPGLNTLVLENVSAKLLTRTVQVLHPEVNLISAQLERRYSKDEIAKLENERSTCEAQLNALNKKIENLGSVNRTSDLESIFEFHERRVSTLKNRISALDHRLEMANQANETIESAKGKLTLLVSNISSVTSGIKVKYVSGGAGWAPYYEINSGSARKDLELEFIVKMMNQTGEDWTNVNLTVSSAFPLDDPIQLPEVEPWLVSSKYDTEQLEEAESSERASVIAPLEGVEYVETLVPSSTVVHKVPGNHTIPANGAVYAFEITKHRLPITYSYHCVPMSEQSCFLVAKATNWKDLDLMNAPAMVFNDGINIGETYVDVAIESDTLDMMIGRTSDVKCERSEIPNETFRKESGGKIRETYTYEFEIKNNKSSNAKVELVDQLPISQHNKIKVIRHDLSKAKVNEDDGEVSWLIQLKPNGSQNDIQLSYSIEYPKSFNRRRYKFRKSTARKKFRAISAPRF